MEKGKLFVNKINKLINNNEHIYYSKDKESISFDNKGITKNVYQKINDIFKSRDYIYKADVIIEKKNNISEKRIIGRNSNYLITSENELIPIKDIIDIKRKEKNS